jgi:hypothetical protein
MGHHSRSPHCFTVALLVAAAAGCGGGTGPAGGTDAARADDARGDTTRADAAPSAPPAGDAGKTRPAPPATWMEHWFEHVQLLQLVDYNDEGALYVDPDVDRSTIGWVMPFLTRLWQYTRQTYGDFGPENRVYWILHQGKYAGGHPSTYFDASHDKRNVADSGPGPWASATGFSIDETSHETGHVVEGANNGMHGSPAFGIWGDSKWMEFYQYDAYLALGMTAEAQRLFTRFTATTDSFPQPGTHWFRDWFYPLWRDHGHAQVMVRFFKLLSTDFRKRGTEYGAGMNFGEFVHFMSGAAGTDLTELATRAFGWPPERQAQLDKARLDFPGVSY